MLTEAGAKKRAKVGLFRPEAIEEGELAHLGPEAVGLGPERLGEILRAGLAPPPPVPAGPAGPGRNRPGLDERDPAPRAGLSPYALSTDLTRTSRSSGLRAAIESEVLAEGLDLRERGVGDAKGRSGSTNASASRARSAARRSRRSTSRSTRSTTAPSARPAGECSKDREVVAAPAVRRVAAVSVLLLACAGCGTAANEHFTIKSKLLGQSMEQAVFVPSGDTHGRPLLVLLHGRSSNPDSMAKKSITNAIGKLGSRAPVVVFANGGNRSYYHDRADGRWGTYILNEVIPAAVRKYDLDGRRVAIGGFSMGGFGALDLARFRRFCAVGGHSAAMWRTGGETPQGAFDNAEDFEQNDVIEAAAATLHLYGRARVWIDIGTDDPFRSANEELARRLAGERFRLWRGDHDVLTLRARRSEGHAFLRERARELLAGSSAGRG